MATKNKKTGILKPKSTTKAIKQKPIPSAGRLFGELVQTPDAVSFLVDNTSVQYYKSAYYIAHRNMLKAIPPPRKNTPAFIKLQDIIGIDKVLKIINAGKIVFHAVGDTGAANKTDLPTEENVADMMVNDFKLPNANDRPSFFFHLGDIVYHFGEDQFYYDQFYNPFRLYNAPIFAIPGNHDGVTYQKQAPSLKAFLNNFCSPQPVHPPEAGSLLRSAMTQPGVYFTLDAPFVSIIGLYSNVLEGPGVISSEGGKYPLDNLQKDFLISELKRLKKQRDNKDIAVIIALHHPPLSGDSKHGGTTGLLNDLDDAFKKANLLPDAILSGHSHLYERFTRTVSGKDITYAVSGSGGFGLTKFKTMPDGTPIKTPFKIPGSDHTLNKYLHAFGYLKITASHKVVEIAFNSPDPVYGEAADSVVINL